MKKYILITFFASTFTFGIAQNQINNTGIQVSVIENGEVDSYMGKSKNIKLAMKNGEIPTTFPKADVNTTKQEYNKRVKFWLKNNEALVLPEKYKNLAPKLD
jgi:hypothetical protein